MTLGIILIKTEVGKEREVYGKIKTLDKVTTVHYLYGEYDIIVLLSTKDPNELTAIVVDKIRAIPGVRNTKTHLKVDLY